MKKQEEYIEIFSHLSDEFSQFNFLINKALTEGGYKDEGLRTNVNLLKSCQSKLWFRIGLGTNGKLYLNFDSDSVILKGLLMVIKDIWEGATLKEIESSSFILMKQVMVDDLLSTKRESSITIIIQKIQQVSKDSE